MTGDVLSWNDSSNNQYIVSGVGSYIINPISAYRTAQKQNKKLADDIPVIEPPKGPVKQIMGAASEFYGIWKFAKNKEAAKEFLRYYAAELAGSLQGERGLQQSVLRRPCAQADADLVERSDIEPARQAGDPAGLGQVVRHPGLSGTGRRPRWTRFTTSSSSTT